MNETLDSLCRSITWFLSEAFEDFRIKIQEKHRMSDCALLICGMAVRKHIIYNITLEKYAEFVDYGNIISK